MADLTDKTDDISIWNDAKTKAVTVTTDGAKERLDVHVAGSVSISGASDSIPIQIRYQKSFSAINANEWQQVATYTVPAGYHFGVSSFRCYSETAGESARVFLEKTGGTFVCATNTFTDGIAFTAPQFGAGLHLYLTTATPNILDDLVTITYTNEVGTTGRTCTINIPKNSPIGTSIEGILQGTDLGVRDITNITHSATGQAGAFSIDVHLAIFQLLMTSSGVMYQGQSISGNPISFDPADIIVLAILAGTKTSYTRYLSLFGTLEAI